MDKNKVDGLYKEKMTRHWTSKIPGSNACLRSCKLSTIGFTRIEELYNLLFFEDFRNMLKQKKVKIHGKKMHTPYESCLFSNKPGVSYRHAGVKYHSLIAPTIICNLLHCVCEFFQLQFNSIVVNRYIRHSECNDYIRLHSDEEKDLTHNIVVVVTIERDVNPYFKFILQVKKTKEKFGFVIGGKEGAVMIMDGDQFQKETNHGIEHEKKRKEPSFYKECFSFTFRCMNQ